MEVLNIIVFAAYIKPVVTWLNMMIRLFIWILLENCLSCLQNEVRKRTHKMQLLATVVNSYIFSELHSPEFGKKKAKPKNRQLKMITPMTTLTVWLWFGLMHFFYSPCILSVQKSEHNKTKADAKYVRHSALKMQSEWSAWKMIKQNNNLYFLCNKRKKKQ